MSEPALRYEVCEFSGYLIDAGRWSHRYTNKHKTSFYILDTLNLYNIVRTIENDHGFVSTSVERLRERAYRFCAQLNAEDARG